MNWDIKLCGSGNEEWTWGGDEYDQNTVYEILNGLIEIFFFQIKGVTEKEKEIEN